MNEEKNVVLEMKATMNEYRWMGLVSDARFSKHKEYIQIDYDGSELHGGENSVTSIKIFDNKSVELTTLGKGTSGNMVFMPGVTQFCYGNGDEPICISTSTVRTTENDSGGSVSIQYSVGVNSVLSSRNSMNLTYRYSDK